MAASCIIHDSKFTDRNTKPDIKYFTSVTFSKFLVCRKLWIHLQGDQNCVAEKSFDYISEADEDRFAREGNLDLPLPEETTSQVITLNVSTAVSTVLSGLTSMHDKHNYSTYCRSHASYSGVTCDIQNIWSTL